ncbi:B-cell receptor CD22-like isoform X2 [Cimex lectularius]|uniref:Ig-like domain-containing protein n=1 Tax=Cimex lectularius TaxID=79782 RepID=A0A8I6SFV8_CIMLE|nr:B-cell receptor CD22-like isoform X2 [Cimex lectularius]
MSLDSRGKVSEMGSHWKDKDVLEERSYFRTVTEPATLSIDNVQESDEATYRCRVDFKTSPTRNYRVKLSVIVPPQKPTVFDDTGKEIPSVAGPYEEGADLKLTCVVSGGRPEPTVRWWIDEKLVESNDLGSSFPNVKNNQLIVRHLERHHLHTAYTCQASNNNISQPLSIKITLEMHLKPIKASIINDSLPAKLSADQLYEIRCETYGSRPPAKITWWKDDKPLKNYIQKGSEYGNMTVSILNFTPLVEDNGVKLVCRAENPYLTGATVEASRKIDVSYVPRVKLELGSKMNPDDIEENDGVYFECIVDANPPAYKVMWKHNNKLLHSHKADGIIINHKDLVLQEVKKTQAGNYTCGAANEEGDGYSNIVHLKVMYKPVCREDQKHVFGVARNEDARVMCEVDAFPPPDDFKWSFNNSAESVEISPSKYHNSLQLSLSTLSYTPRTEMDYGTVMCWASNTAGPQRTPCVFHIIPAGRPDTPFNCSVMNYSASSLDVDCIEAFDGGQPQRFQLQIFDGVTNTLIANKTSRRASFYVGDLPSGSFFKMSLYAFNSKGRSESVNIEGRTIKATAKPSESQVPFAVTPVVVVLMVALVVLITCAVVIFGALRIRSSVSAPAQNQIEKVKQSPSSDVHDKYCIDDNPDIIPSNKESKYQMPAESALPAKVNQAQFLTIDNMVYHEVPHANESVDNFNQRYRAAALQPVVNSDVAFGGGSISRELDRMSEPLICGNQQPIRFSQPQHIGEREVISVRTPLMPSQQESCV